MSVREVVNLGHKTQTKEIYWLQTSFQHLVSQTERKELLCSGSSSPSPVTSQGDVFSCPLVLPPMRGCGGPKTASRKPPATRSIADQHPAALNPTSAYTQSMTTLGCQSGPAPVGGKLPWVQNLRGTKELGDKYK